LRRRGYTKLEIGNEFVGVANKHIQAGELITFRIGARGTISSDKVDFRGRTR
jgi:hypothetical protein